MLKGWLRASFNRNLYLIALIFVLPTSLVGQESPFVAALKTSMIEPVAPSPFVQKTESHEQAHRFWDRKNCLLFATVGAMNTADFVVTRNNLAHGGKELNPMTRPFAGSTAGLAVNFAGETAGYIGVSYLFHKTGHHKLERITSLVSIGSSAGAVAFGLGHH